MSMSFFTDELAEVKKHALFSLLYVQTLIPFMTRLQQAYPGKTIGSVTVDSGYESEENYCWFEQHPETELYVKPSDHEIRKHKSIERISVEGKI